MTARFIAQVANVKPRFKVKTLSLALTVLSAALVMPAYALVEVSESEMSDATAEGVAFLPENLAMLFRGAGTTNNAAGVMTNTIGTTTETVASLLDPITGRNNDTGYIRFIPVGPLTAQATADPIYGSRTGKADLFLYGLALSKGNADANSRFNVADPLIASWGTAANPWLMEVETQTAVPNFAPTGTGDVTYLSLEAPLYNLTKPTTAATGADAYNLKLAFWADAFVRNPTVAENMGATGGQFDVGGTGRANRLRLQAVMDGFSINGTRLQVFQTLGGATAGATGGNANDTFYNNTLGLAGVVRINSGNTCASDTAICPGSVAGTFKATTGGTVARTATNVRTNLYSPIPGTTNSTATQPGAGTAGTPSANPAQLYQLSVLRTTDTYTNSSWVTPTNMPVVRFSTRETTNTGLLDTPAIGTLAGGGVAPTFDATEGLFLYGLNVNLVLGSLAQPLIVGKEAGTNNLVFELTRIPNKFDLYKQIYTNYDDSNPLTNGGYTGSTCNAYQCGTPIQVNGVNTYQGNTATHSSISIGSTEYNSLTNILTAYKGAGALGVSFGAMTSTPTTATTTQNYYQLMASQRRRGTNTQWQYFTTAGTWVNGANNCGTAGNFNCNEFNLATGYFDANANGISVDNLTYPGINPTVAHTPAVTVTNRNNTTSFVIPAWGPMPGANYNPTTQVWQSNLAPATPSAATPLMGNNLGSAVIDGILIQHLKFTTKGL